MSTAYASRTRRPPRTLTREEQEAVLRVTGEHKRGFRDHCILSLALGTALRESEILALDIGDVYDVERGKVPIRVYLRVYKRAGGRSAEDREADRTDQWVALPDATRYKLEKWVKLRLVGQADKTSGEIAAMPLFVSREGHRLSARRVRAAFREWQVVAGIQRLYGFHALRHTAGTEYAARVKDVFMVRRFMRHANMATTARYIHATDDDLIAAAKEQVS